MPDLSKLQDAPMYEYGSAVPGVLSIEDRERLKREAEAKQAEANAALPDGRAWELANELENSTYALDRAAHAPELPPDDTFAVTEEYLNEITKDVANERLDDVRHIARTSFSDAEVRHRLNQYHDLADKEATLAGLGWTGVGLRVGAAAADPLTYITGGATAALSAVRTGGRLLRMSKMAGLNALENASIEAVVSGTNEARSPDDMLWSILAGSAFGTVFGAASRRIFTDAERTAYEKLAKGAQNDIDRLAAVHMPPEKAAKLREGLAMDDTASPAVAKSAPAGEPHVTMDEHARRLEAPDDVTSLRAKAQEASDMLALSTRTLKRDAELLEHFESRIGETKDLGSGVSVTTRKKVDDSALSPEAKAVLKLHLDEDGNVTKGSLYMLRESVEAMRKEVALLKKRADTYAGIAKVREAKKSSPAGKAEVPAEGTHQSAGSAAVSTERLPEAHFNPEAHNLALVREMEAAPMTKFAKARFDIMSKIKSSPNPVIRWMGSRMAEDPVANMMGEALEIGASEVGALVQRLAEVAFYKAATPAYHKWLEEAGHGFASRLTKRREFFEQVTAAVRGGGSADKNVEEAAEALRGIFKDMGERAREARLEGFEDFTPNPKYMPRIHDAEQVIEHDVKYGTKQMNSFIAAAIRSANPDIAAEIADKIAKGYWNRIRGLAAGTDIHNLSHKINLDNKELVRTILAEGKLPASEIEHVLTALDKVGPKGEPKIARAKSRLLLDEEFSMDLTHGANSPDGSGKVDTVKITDLFENNAEKLFQQYSRSMSGHIALAEKFRPLLEPGESFSRTVFDRWIQRAAEMGADTPGYTKAQLQKDTKRLQFLWDAVTGAPLEGDPKSLFTRTTRRLRDYNFVRVMNQVGFAQVAEIGNIIGMGGIRNMMRQIPEFKGMLVRAQNGELDSTLAREMESVLGIGTEWIRHVAVSRWDNLEYLDRGKTGAVDAALDVGKRFTAVASGMVPVNTVLHRFTGLTLAQRLASMAKGIEAVNVSRVRSLGLTEQMQERVFKMLREKAEWDGDTLKSINIEAWDKEAANAFTYAMFRGSRRIIQENDVGAMADWMHGSLAKVLLQFRSFAINAWSKQLLHGIAHNDMQTYISWSMGMMFAGMSYIAQTHLNAIGRDDRKKYLKERLDPRSLTLAAIQRTGASSLLPIPIDSVWSLYDDKPLFQGRTTGQMTGLIQGISAVDIGTKAHGSLSGAIKSALRSDYDFSKRDLRATMGMLPFQNFAPIAIIQNKLSSELPDFSTSR